MIFAEGANWKLHQGDTLTLTAELPKDSISCIVTSPPYWGLRDYGLPPTEWPAVRYAPMAGLPAVEIPAQTCCLGLESDPLAFVGHIVQIWRNLRHAMQKDATCWINFGDTYAGSGRGGNGDLITGRAKNASQLAAITPLGLKPKQMIGIPWRVAFALQADGWYLRQDIIWSKTQPMPESTRDRCTKAHEYLFLVSTSPIYHFDQEAISEPCSPNTHARAKAGWRRDTSPDSTGASAGEYAGAPQKKPSGWNSAPGGHHGLEGNYPWSKEVKIATPPKAAHNSIGTKNNAYFDAAMRSVVERRKKRSVWEMGSSQFTGAHFATFPPELVRPCIRAGCKPGGTVADIFSGSGTTGIVAGEEGRPYVGFDLNPDYLTMSVPRLLNVQSPLF